MDIMEHSSDNLSIRERMKRAAELRNQYGSEIPQDLLSEINYVSIEGEDGEFTLMTAELFAKRALEKKVTPEVTKTPFETVRFSVDVSAEVGARISKSALHAKIEDTYEKVGYMYHGESFGRFSTYQTAIAERYPQLATLASRFDAERSRIAAQHFNVDPPTTEAVMNDAHESGISVLTAIAEDICSEEHDTDMTDYEDSRSFWWNTDTNHVPPEVAQRILTINQQTRAALTDAPELKHFVQPAFEKNTAFPGISATDDEGEWLVLPTHITGWDISRQALSNMLSEDNFSTTAKAISHAETFEDATSIIDASVKTNERLRELKQAQKDLQSSSLDPHERFAKQSEVKNQIKSARQTITAMQQLLHFNQTYAEYAGSILDSLDETLIHKTSKTAVVIDLDARPDKNKDADPGRMSGDCTEGKPLPFGQEPGLANIKVSIDGEYVGNIYSYQTNSRDARSVWHLDAVQIPSRTIDWQTFPDTFVRTLEPFARDKGIDMITINSKQYEISNYDYVAKGFMSYLRADTAAVTYDNMEQPDTAGEITGSDVKTVAINFPKTLLDEQYSSLQGERSRQIILWENDKKRE